VKEYKETHQQGLISIENLPWDPEKPVKVIKGDFGIQIAADGRVWVCINGVAFIRFKPLTKKGEREWEEYHTTMTRI